MPAGKDLQQSLDRSQQEREQLEEQLASADQKVTALESKSKDLQQQVHILLQHCSSRTHATFLALPRAVSWEGRLLQAWYYL